MTPAVHGFCLVATMPGGTYYVDLFGRWALTSRQVDPASPVRKAGRTLWQVADLTTLDEHERYRVVAHGYSREEALRGFARVLEAS